MPMKRIIMPVLAFAGAFSLCADPVFPATTASEVTFDVCSVDGTSCAVSSVAEIAELLPVTWRAGETVTLMSPSGIVMPLVSAPSAAGMESLSSLLHESGIWTLENSLHGIFRIGVAWSVYGEAGRQLADCVSDTYAVDSKQKGPNRKVNMPVEMPIAYTGDNWGGDAMAASTLAFVSPSGLRTTLDLAGTGVAKFTFDKTGVWHVNLVETVNGAEHEAVIKVSGGFVVLIQ